MMFEFIAYQVVIVGKRISRLMGNYIKQKYFLGLVLILFFGGSMPSVSDGCISIDDDLSLDFLNPCCLRKALYSPDVCFKFVLLRC